MSENGAVPAGWREANITDLCSQRPHSLKRGPFGSAIRKDCFVPSGFKVYEQQHAIQDDFSLGTYYVDKEKFDELSAFAVSPGDLIISCAGTIGKIAVVPDWAEPGIINQALLKITLNPGVVAQNYFVYLFRFLSSQLSARGTGMQNLAGVKELKKVRFPLPPLPDQRRIVAEIEKQFTRLEAGVAALRRVQANLKRYRAAVLKAACEGKLVPTQAELAKVAAASRRSGKDKQSRDGSPTFETGEQLLQRILAQRRNNWLARQSLGGGGTGRGKYKEPAAPDTANLPPLPQGWTWATIEQLSTRVQYGSSAKTNEDSTGVPVLRMGNIQDGKFDLDKLKYLPKAHEEFPELVLARGDLLFNRTNSPELVGKTAVFKDTPSPCSFASYLIRVRFEGGCVPDFASYFINSVFGRAWIADVVSQQVGQANVNGTKLQALAIPLPPLAEQTRIVAEVERRLSVVEELEAVVSANLQRASRLRQSILQKAFTGKLA